MEADFSGYATKAGLRCSDGRTITSEAFKHMDGKKVPLVWQHGHNEPKNVLGHAMLEAREDGVYAYGFFNKTEHAAHMKEAVEHGDVSSMSIYANQLVEKAKQVFHGTIREVSLVLSGANPGALIDNVRIAHSDDDVETLDDEAVIYTGLTLSHADGDDSDDDTPDDETVQDVLDSLSQKQTDVVMYMIGAALEEGAASHSDEDDNGLEHKEGNTTMGRNVFDQNGSDNGTGSTMTLSHEDVKGIVADAMKVGSFKEAVEGYALQHGIENIDVLFPDAKAVTNTPEWDSRRVEWVKAVLNGTKHTPFSRIKSLVADLTYDDARAKGYIKGTMKKEEFFGVAKRTTGPTTIYKKQKLDRDDIIDITDFDVVVWLKAEMRLMLDEEIARAVLIGDGRDVEDEDKISETNIRPIASDDDLYSVKVNVPAGGTPSDIVDALIANRTYYKGTGTPTMFTTEAFLTRLLLAKDTTGRRLYRTVSELASELRVSSIETVEVMESQDEVVAILVNLADYTIGADRGGDVTMFDDFDIDYNQYKYLIETRISGALTKIKSALVVREVDADDDAVAPVAPSRVGNAVTIPTVTGLAYTNNGVAVADGATITLTEGSPNAEIAVAAESGYYLSGGRTNWTYTFRA